MDGPHGHLMREASRASHDGSQEVEDVTSDSQKATLPAAGGPKEREEKEEEASVDPAIPVCDRGALIRVVWRQTGRRRVIGRCRHVNNIKQPTDEKPGPNQQGLGWVLVVVARFQWFQGGVEAARKNQVGKSRTRGV